MNEVPIERVRELLRYEPMEHGSSLVWKVDRGKNKTRGCRAGGRTPKRYWIISIDGKQFYAHRLVWAVVKGEDPPYVIDHIDRNPSNNLIDNLRLCPNGQKENMQNIGFSVCNKTGYRGVTFCNATNKYRAKISVDDRTVHLGRFDSPEEAHAAYLKAKNLFHPRAEDDNENSK